MAPIRRERARQPEPGSNLLRRYTPLSLAVHVGVAALSLISFPALRGHERPVYAKPIYQVALMPSQVPNYEPPFPQPEKRKEPVPAKPVVTEAKPKQKAAPPKETVPVKSAKPTPKTTETPPKTAPGTAEKMESPSPTSAPQE
ncbi:MAG TPA: hypothetical protein VFP10_13805, partial [Candidatus Eisenbacteria bacterium]|nr:hypothetical protein [Candidatus Eisenbacteria bacterium]